MARSPRTAPVVLAVLIAALLAVAVPTAIARHGGRGGRAVDGAVGPVVVELQAFVESARGLPFVRPVDVAVVTDAAFRRKLSGGRPTDRSDADVQTGVLRALGLVQKGDNLDAATALDPASVAGFYDAQTKELVVRGARLTPFVRQVLVHELTHALDDQHFGLDRDFGDEEAALAFEALVEGDALTVEGRYVASLSPAERKEAATEEDATVAGGAAEDVPAIAVALSDLPYRDGPGLVAALLGAGGPGRLDAAFRAPPTTSAEVLHPARFLAGRGRAGVPPVPAGGTVVDDGPLGEVVLRVVLATSVPDDEAGRAADGWAGDGYVAWKAGNRTCVRATVVLDSAAEAAELATALRRWAGDHPGATVGPAGPAAVTLSRCG